MRRGWPNRTTFALGPVLLAWDVAASAAMVSARLRLRRHRLKPRAAAVSRLGLRTTEKPRLELLLPVRVAPSVRGLQTVLPDVAAWLCLPVAGTDAQQMPVVLPVPSGQPVQMELGARPAHHKIAGVAAAPGRLRLRRW